MSNSVRDDSPHNSETPAPVFQGVVPITYVQLLYEYLSNHGIEPVVFLGEALPKPEHGIGRFPLQQWRVYLHKAAAELNDPMLGMHLGACIAPRHLGLLGYVLLACGNVGGALARLQQYHQLIYDAAPMRIDMQGDECRLVWGQEVGRPGALVDETAIAALVQFCRDITGQPSLSLVNVSFINPEPDNVEAYFEWFQCPVHFDQAETQVVLNNELLSIPLRSADPALTAILQQQADALLESLPARGEGDLLRQVRQHISEQLQQGEPSAERLAAQLNITVRTLHRKLETEGLNFRQLLQQTRHHLAKQYLKDPRLQLAEIALLLGYSEQSALSRAFKQWQGQTLRQYRQALV